MKIIITIDLGLVAYSPGLLREALTQLLQQVPGWAAEPRRGHEDYSPIEDAQGNHVGHVVIEDITMPTAWSRRLHRRLREEDV